MLNEELTRKLELDVANGFTSVGPQRAEIEVFTEGCAAEKTLSRGQQKMLVIALNFALIGLMQARHRQAPLVLVDDLAAELDLMNQERVLDGIAGDSVQAFVTSIRDPGKQPPTPAARTVFHVEHGRLQDP